MKKIFIIGGGWYGCYVAYILSNQYDIYIFEKESDIFKSSSYYNQNRLHLGYHYPRSDGTRKLCRSGYSKFLQKFKSLADDIDDNYYAISKDSIIDYQTFINIFKPDYYDYELIENNDFTNIDGKLIKVTEKVINSKKSKQFFKEQLKDKVKFVFNYQVNKIEDRETLTGHHIGNKIIINDGEYTGDFLFDCTYNQLQLHPDTHLYEKSLSLIYKKATSKNYSLTVMDGPFCSIYPQFKKENIYTLTDVKETPLIKSKNINDIYNYSFNKKILEKKKKLFESNIKNYIPHFKEHFQYIDHFLSFKCKLVSSSDSRELVIEYKGNRLSVNCGKITGIFELEDFIKRHTNIKLV